MQSAETVLGVLRERGRRGLPCDELYRQMFNPQLYLLAYGRIYSNQGAMTPGATEETVDGMSIGKIDRIIDAVRHERYRFSPARRTYIPKKNGKMRPLGMPTWSDKLVGEVVRLLLEAYYEPTFSDRSHGFRSGRGCHTALREVAITWTGTQLHARSARLTARSLDTSRPSAVTTAIPKARKPSPPRTANAPNRVTSAQADEPTPDTATEWAIA